jgi:hypothetical protein
MKNIVFFTRIRVKRVLVRSDAAAKRPTTTTCDSKLRLSILKSSSTTVTRSPILPEPIPVMESDPITPISKTPKRSKKARSMVINSTATKRIRSLLESNFIGMTKELFFRDDKGQKLETCIFSSSLLVVTLGQPTHLLYSSFHETHPD